MSAPSEGSIAQKAAGSVLLTLCAAQFLMALDSSVMNVSIATVAEDLGTTITGIQTAIVLYTLVMAMLMVTGGKIGSIIGRKRAFVIGCVIYCSGSLTTSLSPEPRLAHLRLVLPRGGRGGVDHARDRGARRRQLPGRRPPARLRARRCGRRDRRRRRPADRRARHHVRVVALGVRRRGARGGGHPLPGPQGRRRSRRRPATPGLVGFGALGRRRWAW